MPPLTVEDLRAARKREPAEGGRPLTVRDLIAVGSGNQSAEYLRKQRVEAGQRTWAGRTGTDEESTVRAYARAPGLANTAKSAGRLGLEMLATTYTGGTGQAAKIGLPLVKKALQVGAAGGASSLASEAWDPSEKPLQRAAQTAAYAAGGEAVGGALARGLNRLIQGGTKLEPGAVEAIEQLEKRGVTITPGQTSQNPLIDVFQNMSESSLTGFKPLRDMREAAEAAAMLDVDEYVAQFLRGRGAEEVGGSIQDAIVASGKMRRAVGSEMYGWLDELLDYTREAAEATGRRAPGAGIDISDAVKLAQREIHLSGGRNEKIAKVAKWVMDAIEDGKPLSFGDAQRLRSDLLGIGRIGDEVIQGQAQAVAKRLASKIDAAMMNYAKGLDPDLEAIYRGVNAFWKKTAETFGDRFIKSLLKAEPERVLKKVANKDMPGTIRKVRRAVIDPLLRGPEKREAERVWREVQGHTLLRIARDAQDSAMQTQGKRALRILDKYGEDTLNELFLSKEELGTFKRLLRTLEITQSPAGEALPGGVFVQLGQAGALIGVLSGHFGAKAMAFVVAPEIIKRTLTNKSFVRWATIGSKSPPGSKAALRAYSRMQAIVASEMSLDENQKEQTQ